MVSGSSEEVLTHICKALPGPGSSQTHRESCQERSSILWDAAGHWKGEMGDPSRGRCSYGWPRKIWRRRKKREVGKGACQHQADEAEVGKIDGNCLSHWKCASIRRISFWHQSGTAQGIHPGPELLTGAPRTRWATGEAAWATELQLCALAELSCAPKGGDRGRSQPTSGGTTILSGQERAQGSQACLQDLGGCAGLLSHSWLS